MKLVFILHAVFTVQNANNVQNSDSGTTDSVEKDIINRREVYGNGIKGKHTISCIEVMSGKHYPAASFFLTQERKQDWNSQIIDRGEKNITQRLDFRHCNLGN